MFIGIPLDLHLFISLGSCYLFLHPLEGGQKWKRVLYFFIDFVSEILFLVAFNLFFFSFSTSMEASHAAKHDFFSECLILEKSFLRHSSRTVRVFLGDTPNLHDGFLIFPVLFLISFLLTIQLFELPCVLIPLLAFATKKISSKDAFSKPFSIAPKSLYELL